MVRIFAENLMVRLKSHAFELSGAGVEMDALPWVVSVVVVGLVVAFLAHRAWARPPAARTRSRKRTP